MWSELHLLRPFWLLALLPALLLWLLLYRHRQQPGLWHNLIARHLQPVVLLGEQLQKRQPLALPLLALCWLLAVLALSGPSWQKLPQPALTVKQATVLIMDMSLSMRATDLVPDRLTQQRFKALDFIDKLREGELALISYAADAFVISPLTPDHNNIRLQVPNLRPELMPAQGSNVLAALELADQLLTQAGFASGEVILFTDGFEAQSFHALQQLLNRYPHRLSVLAFGSAEGAVVRLENGELLKDRQGGVVVPRVPLQQLAVLARQGGGQFRQAVADNSDLEALVQALRNPQASKGETPVLSGDVWQDGAVYLVWLLLPLALWLGRRAAVLMLCLIIYIPPANANSWQQLWQTQQQRAQQAYQQGNYAKAREQFQDPLWQGNAAYRAGDYQQAEQAYRQALAQGENASLWHNLGNTLALQQELEQALSAFQRASELDPEHSAARQNAELMQQLLEQQQAEQQAQQQSEEQQEQQSSDSNESSADNASQNAKDNAEEQADNAQQSAQQAEQSPPDESEPQQTDANSAQQAEAQLEPAQDETQDTAAQAVINEPWPNATPEQQQELENLLRKVQDDPGVLLRNRMLLEYQKRRHSLPPQGAQQEW